MWKANCLCLRGGILLLGFQGVPAPFEASTQQLPCLPSLRAGPPQTRRTEASCCSRAKGDKERGGRGDGWRGWKPRKLLLGPSQIPPAPKCGPRPGPGCAFCPDTLLVFQDVADSRWPLVLAVTTMTKGSGAVGSGLAPEQLLPSPCRGRTVGGKNPGAPTGPGTHSTGHWLPRRVFRSSGP